LGQRYTAGSHSIREADCGRISSDPERILWYYKTFAEEDGRELADERSKKRQGEVDWLKEQIPSTTDESEQILSKRERRRGG